MEDDQCFFWSLKDIVLLEFVIDVLLISNPIKRQHKKVCITCTGRCGFLPGRIAIERNFPTTKVLFHRGVAGISMPKPDRLLILSSR